MFSKTTSRRCAAALSLPFFALAATAYAQTSSSNSMMASYICRPVTSGESSNAKMGDQGTALVCHPFAVRLHMDNGSMKVIGNVTAKPMSGPDFSKALTVDQANEAWNNWVQEKLRVPLNRSA